MTNQPRQTPMFELTAPQEVENLRTEIESIRVALRGDPDSNLASLAKSLTARVRDADLALATICDQVLGEDAADRADDTLIRRIGELLRAARSVVDSPVLCGNTQVEQLRRTLEQQAP